MKSAKYSIVSIESEVAEEMIEYVDRETEEKLLARRRYIKLVCIPLVFILSFGLLALSVVHDVQARALSAQQVEPTACSPTDLPCVSLLCPAGMSWSGESSKCEAEQGYTCCPTCTQQYTCVRQDQAREDRCCHLLGILPSSYKLMCRPGWVWVEWQQRCFRVIENQHPVD